MQGRAPEIRRLTAVLLDCLSRSHVDGAERIIVNSGGRSQKGTACRRCLRTSWSNSFLTRCTNHRGGAPGLLHGRRSGFNRRRGYITGARLLGTAERARAREEKGRWRWTPRVSSGGERRFIGNEEQRCGSWRRRSLRARHRATSPSVGWRWLGGSRLSDLLKG
jgi:hypothetical protein